MYSYVWGQCTRGMQSIIKADKEYSEEFHIIWLLQKIKEVMAGVNEDKNKCVLLRTSMIYFLTLRQWGKRQSSSIINDLCQRMTMW